MDCIVLTLYRVEFTSRVSPDEVVIRTAPPAGLKLHSYIQESVQDLRRGGRERERGEETSLEVLGETVAGKDWRWDVRRFRE